MKKREGLLLKDNKVAKSVKAKYHKVHTFYIIHDTRGH